MNNPLYKHLSNLKILYPKQFGFQKGHSTDRALLQLVNQIFKYFERSEYTIVFIDLPKVFDSVSHNILLKKITFLGGHNIHFIYFLTTFLKQIKQNEMF